MATKSKSDPKREIYSRESDGLPWDEAIDSDLKLEIGSQLPSEEAPKSDLEGDICFRLPSEKATELDVAYEVPRHKAPPGTLHICKGCPKFAGLPLKERLYLEQFAVVHTGKFHKLSTFSGGNKPQVILVFLLSYLLETSRSLL